MDKLKTTVAATAVAITSATAAFADTTPHYPVVTTITGHYIDDQGVTRGQRHIVVGNTGYSNLDDCVERHKMNYMLTPSVN